MKTMLATAFISCLLLACGQTSNPSADNKPMRLTPLPPYHHVFSNQSGNHRIDYFFVEGDRRRDARFREELQRLVKAEQSKAPPTDGFYSIYVYQKTAALNEGFTGGVDGLRGVYDGDLISYSRWNSSEMDIFYIIDQGNVVFDMLKNREVSPPWEFD